MTDAGPFIAGLVVLLILDFLGIAARSAYTEANHARLLAMREQREAEVVDTLALIPSLPRIRASLNFLLLFVRFSLAGLILFYLATLPLVYPLLSYLLVLFVSVFLIFWFEWAVERHIGVNPEIWAMRMVPFARLIMSILAVFVFLPLNLSNEPQMNADGSATVTEDELKTLVDAGQEEGLFELGERRMFYSIFELGDTLAREIMVPRIDMLALEANTPLPDAVDAFLRSGHSRVPVFEDTVDNTLGLLYAKDLLRVWREGNQIESLRDLLRRAYFIPEAKKVDELLTEMQSQRIHMAIVVDEYGGVAGLVTLEDIVEEILGEIRDEYDQAEELPYQRMKNGEYIFQGRVDLDDFNEIMGSDLSKDEADTVGGLIYSEIGSVPNVGDKVQKNGLLLTVEQVSGRRIRKVRARWLPTEPGNLEEKDEANG